MAILKRLMAKLARASRISWDEIAIETTGFRTGARHIDWAEVTSIAVFKRDLVTFDDVWFQLEFAGESVLICEEQPGFVNWVAELCRQFPDVACWRESVILPAFSENFVVLYSSV
ncbi:MAG: hypothetical protein ACSHXK_14100 [Oceanococcus sp.]